MFSLVHATNRPLGWQAVYAQYLRQAKDPECFEYILCFDKAKESAFRETVPEYWFEPDCPNRKVIINWGDENYVTAANFSTQCAQRSIILEVTDDMFPPLNWDHHLEPLFPIGGSRETVIWVTDQAFPHIMTMQIFTRKWYHKYGYVFHPDFPSMLGDHDFTWRANRDNVVVDVRDRLELHWTHEHHRNRKRAKDASDIPNESAERYAEGWNALNRHCPGYMKTDPIDALYASACANESDINEHLPLLKELAAGKTILELGTRTGNSTIAFLAARPKRLVSVDLDFSRLDPQIPGAAIYSGIPFRMVQQDSREFLKSEDWYRSRQADEDFEVVFFDTIHTYEHLKAEIAQWSHKANERLIFHDTVSNGEIGEDGRHPGLMAAINELVAMGDWKIERHIEANNGLTVLARIAK